jgi:hypothetical protein
MRRPLTFLTAIAVAVLVSSRPAPAQVAGDFVVSEFLPDPVQQTSTGEWVEFYNTSGGPIDIEGWDVLDNSATFTINTGSPVIVPAGGFVVVGKSTNPLTNGGLPGVDLVWSTMALGNGTEEITLRDTGDNVICHAAFSVGDPFGNGVSLELVNFSLHKAGTGTPGETEHATLFVTDYQAGASTYNGGNDFGSPGTAGAMVPVELSGIALD